MVRREEIEQLIETQGLREKVELIWGINCSVVPKLCANGEEGEDCRFGLAEHIVHKFFATQTAKDLSDDAFNAFCERFQASEQDIATALERTRQDLKTEEVSAPDVATTLIWLWFVDASKGHGIYDTELKFFLYTVADMSRGDTELKQNGLENLVQNVKDKPSLLFRLLSCVTRKKH